MLDAAVYLQQENLRGGDASLGQRDVVRSPSGATRTWIDGSPVFETSNVAGTLTHPSSGIECVYQGTGYWGCDSTCAAVTVTGNMSLKVLLVASGRPVQAWSASSACSSLFN